MDQLKGNQKFAVLLCRVKSTNPVNLHPKEFFEDLFVNDSEDGLNRFLREASHDNISLTGSKVFDWREVDFEGISDSIDRIFKAAEHFAKEGKDQVDFRSFTGIIVVTDINIGLTGTSRRMFNLNGETLPYRVVICDQVTDHTMIAHEMGHSFGLNHSCNGDPESCDPKDDGTPGAYCDSWDIMSAGLVDSFESLRFGNSGPLLNAVNMNFLGWLNESRVIEASGKTYNNNIQLRPLSRPDLPGTLAIQFSDLLIEFRINKGWDSGFDGAGILIHKVRNQESMLVGFPNIQFLKKGDQYKEGNNRWGPYWEINVIDIDLDNELAVINVYHKPLRIDYQIGIIHWIVDGIIGISPGGKPVVVTPRPPIHDILIGVAMNELADTLKDSESKAALRQASMNLIAETAKKEINSLRD
ncbi:hypothetical protein FKQ51_14315 [Bacillus toyonensis]|uniref:M12 family metallo-peptidase n=1 Tax=Bacillus toyonensis TaxID=155322 RepID=UPI00270D7F46|nr:M12 family metallo-peptidase [Bacillus toyonensis]MDO8158513.1 hypothetical protein [Bacillus toyonensis]